MRNRDSYRRFGLAVLALLMIACDGSHRLCEDTCAWANDGECDDGRDDAVTALCALGTDCGDCGPNDQGSSFRLSPQDPTWNDRVGAAGSPPTGSERYPPTAGRECGDRWECGEDGAGIFRFHEESGDCVITLYGDCYQPWYPQPHKVCVVLEDGRAGCQWEGTTDPGSRFTHCVEYALCDNGSTVEKCFSDEAFTEVNDGHGWDAARCNAWLQNGGGRHECGACVAECGVSEVIIASLCEAGASSVDAGTAVDSGGGVTPECRDQIAGFSAMFPALSSCLQGCLRSYESCMLASGCARAEACASQAQGCLLGCPP